MELLEGLHPAREGLAAARLVAQHPREHREHAADLGLERVDHAAQIEAAQHAVDQRADPLGDEIAEHAGDALGREIRQGGGDRAQRPVEVACEQRGAGVEQAAAERVLAVDAGRGALGARGLGGPGGGAGDDGFARDGLGLALGGVAGAGDLEPAAAAV